MDPNLLTTDILIVGAGPTGLTLANILGQAGVNVVIIDRKPSTVMEPRAVSIDDESLRTMQAVGLADEVLRDVVTGYGVFYYTAPGGRCFAKVEPTASDYGFPRRNAFRQPLFEATLREGLKRFPSVQILFNHTLASFVNGPDAVSATVTRDNGTTLRIDARYMAGCDGGRSPVREMLGIVMAGSSFKSRWLVIDTEEDDDPFWQTRVYCGARRPVVEVPGPHHTRRFEILIHPHEDADEAMSPERMAELLRPFRGDRPVKLVRKVVYTFHARMAERWRVKRVFLAGDAAHLTPPYAGQGMNSGVRDAHNLGWKLAAVLNGQLSDSALDSYESERRHHAWSLIRLALYLGEVMAPRTRVHAWLIQTFFTLAAYIPPLRDYFLQMKFKPKPRYTAGLLGPEKDAAKTSIRGRMFPQPRVTVQGHKEELLDNILGHRFALIVHGEGGAETLKTLRHPLWQKLDLVRVLVLPAGAGLPPAGQATGAHVVVVDSGGTLARTFAMNAGKVVLVRPDRYVAGTFHAQDENDFADQFAVRLGIGGMQARHRADVNPSDSTTQPI
jgi:3-(3-hydroxy-phenyl)propionate hydroxylase